MVERGIESRLDMDGKFKPFYREIKHREMKCRGIERRLSPLKVVYKI